jgi:hypothetical protein
MTKRDGPFPESLCHECAAPPRYVKTKTSTFILCPILPNKYPPQPVRTCASFRRRSKEGSSAEVDEPDRGE